MARIAREIYNKKIETALTAFKASPEPTIKEVNVTLFTQFGGHMNLADIYLVRETARQNGNAEDFLQQQTANKIAAKAKKVVETAPQEPNVVDVVVEPTHNTPEPTQDSFQEGLL
jgi:hypothetical protein